MEGYAAYLFVMVDKVSPATTPLFIFDICLLFMQFFYHRESTREQEGLPPSFWQYLLHSKYHYADDDIVLNGNKVIANIDKINYYRIRQEQKQEKTDNDELKLDETEISGDIYMMAFVAQINPCHVDFGPGYIERSACLLRQERADLYIAALKIASI